MSCAVVGVQSAPPRIAIGRAARSSSARSLSSCSCPGC